MRDFLLSSLLPVLWPLFETVATIAGPILVTWVTVRVISLLKINDDQKKAQVESALRVALHDAAKNALLFAMTKYGVSGALSTNLSDNILYLARKASGSNTVLKGSVVDGSVEAKAKLDDIVSTAVNEYLIPKMPETIKKLGATPEGLSEIVLSKVPTV